jgi:hypothetical protein
VELSPPLEEALSILADLDNQRGFTEEEQARRHAFRMLLKVARRT